MAISMIKIRNGAKGKARKHFNYITKDEYYKNSADEVVYSKVGNLPNWANDNAKLFFETADQYERANGSTYREHIISLPRELTMKQRIDLVNDWIEQEIGNKYAYQAVIHNKTALDGGEQPHLHLMFSERQLDGIDRPAEQFFKRFNSKNPTKGGCRKANTGLKPSERKQQLKELRQRAGDLINKHLAKYGYSELIDVRNWVQRGLDKKPYNMSFVMINEPIIKEAYSEFATEKRLLKDMLKDTKFNLQIKNNEAQRDEKLEKPQVDKSTEKQAVKPNRARPRI